VADKDRFIVCGTPSRRAIVVRDCDERSGDERGASKTYHNLSAVANIRGHFE
jgi:hypothetical protein